MADGDLHMTVTVTIADYDSEPGDSDYEDEPGGPVGSGGSTYDNS